MARQVWSAPDSTRSTLAALDWRIAPPVCRRGFTTLSEVATLAGFIAKAVKFQRLSDADTASVARRMFGRTIYRIRARGLGGCHLEDRISNRCGHLAGKRLVETDEMSAKIGAAVAAKHNPDFLSSRGRFARARDFDGAVSARKLMSPRAQTRFFPRRSKRRRSSAIFRAGMKVPLSANMTEFGKSPLLGVKELGDLGYRMVIFPQSAFPRFDEETDGIFPRANEESGDGRTTGSIRMQTRGNFTKRLRYRSSSRLSVSRRFRKSS